MKTKVMAFGGVVLAVGLVAGSLYFHSFWPKEKETPHQENRAQPAIAKSTKEGTGQDSHQGFHFTMDREGKLLTNLLAPTEPKSPEKSAELISPQPFPVVSSLDRFEIPLPLCRVGHSPLKSTFHGVEIRPRLLSEQQAQALSMLEPSPPQHLQLPSHALVRQLSPVVDQPPPLPLLALGQMDRVTVDDPTKEISGAAALAGAVPSRTSPAPFQRFSLPDPFKNSRAVQLLVPPPEGQPYPVANVPIPGR